MAWRFQCLNIEFIVYAFGHQVTLLMVNNGISLLKSESSEEKAQSHKRGKKRLGSADSGMTELWEAMKRIHFVSEYQLFDRERFLGDEPGAVVSISFPYHKRGASSPVKPNRQMTHMFYFFDEGPRGYPRAQDVTRSSSPAPLANVQKERLLFNIDKVGSLHVGLASGGKALDTQDLYFFDRFEVFDIAGYDGRFVFVSGRGNEGVGYIGRIFLSKFRSDPDDRGSYIQDGKYFNKRQDMFFLGGGKAFEDKQFVFGDHRYTNLGVALFSIFQESRYFLIAAKVIDNNIGINEIAHRSAVSGTLMDIFTPLFTKFVLEGRALGKLGGQNAGALSDDLQYLVSSRFPGKGRFSYQPFDIFNFILELLNAFHNFIYFDHSSRFSFFITIPKISYITQGVKQFKGKGWYVQFTGSKNLVENPGTHDAIQSSSPIILNQFSGILNIEKFQKWFVDIRDKIDSKARLIQNKERPLRISWGREESACSGLFIYDST